MKYYHRNTETLLKKALQQFPVVLITGPRQAGKSTLLRQSLKSYSYVTFDDPALRALAQEDPELFLSTHPAPLILDEIQYAPHLLSYLKMAVDEKRQEYGQYVLTGSQTFQLMHGISETLAGRIAIFDLYPFCWDEIERITPYKNSSKNELQLVGQMITGFYPEFFSNPNIDRYLWFSSYFATYLERDVRNIKAVSDLGRFQTFLGLLAARVGNLLNISEVAKECGISQPTAKDWLSILQATYVIYLLQPYYKSRSKRLVKSPKLYFVDTGLLCYLLGISDAERFLGAKEKGSIFENMVIIDYLKSLSAISRKKECFFYRTQAGVEVDLVVENGSELEAYEIKFSKTPSRKMISSLEHFRNNFPSAKTKLLCLRSQSLALSEEISAVYWRCVSGGLFG